MAPGSGRTGIIADCPHQYLRCAVLINRCKQAERAGLMRREEQVKPGDVPLLRADPKRSKGAGRRAAESGHLNSRPQSNAANAAELRYRRQEVINKAASFDWLLPPHACWRWRWLLSIIQLHPSSLISRPLNAATWVSSSLPLSASAGNTEHAAAIATRS